MDIVVRYEVRAAKQYGGVVKKVINQAAEQVRCPRGVAVSVSFIGDRKMRALARDYRGKDCTANVLSFSTHDSYSMIPGSQNDFGDIFISLPEAKREAKKYRWTMRYAVARLALHGFLHLLGYDHRKEAAARKMEKIEEKILKKFT